MIAYRSMPEIPGRAVYRHGSGNQFRRPGPRHQTPPWEPADHVDPRLAGVPDRPSGAMARYPFPGTISPRNVFDMRPQ